MDFFYISLLITIIIMLIVNQRTLNEKLLFLNKRVLDLQDLIKKLSEGRPPSTEQEIPTTVINSEKPVVVAETIKPPQNVKPTLPPETIGHSKQVIDYSAELRKLRKDVKTEKPNNEPKPSFFEKHPDLEKFIGENLINKIGIAILVLAIGFFVKYAIDSNWIGAIGRVGIGLLCGGVMIAIAHRLRNTYKAFSSVLVGGGLAVFYFTITLAYHQFHLFNQTTSFIILIVITSFAVALSLLYNKQELAVIALVGGFLSPFIVSTGTANYNALFIYLIILNAGLLVMAYYKSWRILNISSFVLTAPKYYTRLIAVYNIENKIPEKICDTSISAEGSQDIFFSAKTTQFRIDITNGDDNKLTISSISAFQQKQYIISYLEAGNSYYMLTGNSLASEANYDLSFLKYKPYNQLPIINHSTIYKNPAYIIHQSVVKQDHTLYIWIAIIIVLILLSFLTWKMVREINQKQSSDI